MVTAGSGDSVGCLSQAQGPLGLPRMPSAALVVGSVLYKIPSGERCGELAQSEFRPAFSQTSIFPMITLMLHMQIIP